MPQQQQQQQQKSQQPESQHQQQQHQQQQQQHVDDSLLEWCSNARELLGGQNSLSLQPGMHQALSPEQGQLASMQSCLTSVPVRKGETILL